MNITDSDIRMVNASVTNFQHLYKALRDLPVADAVRDLSSLAPDIRERYARKDRKDTNFFDVAGEDAISLGLGFSGHMDAMLRAYGTPGVIITEECGRIPRETRIERATPVIISDPVDSTSYFEDIMHRLAESNDRVGAVLDRERDRVGDLAARRHACNTSVTLIKDNAIKYTLVLNLMTGDVYLGWPRGVTSGDIQRASDAESVSTPVRFHGGESLQMLCYTRPEGKYETNRASTHLRFFPLEPAAFAKIGPVGPMRFTNLVRFGEEPQPVGLIAHNGEKIQELLPNVAIAFFSNGELAAYKLFCDFDGVEERAGKDMTPTLANSLYGNGRLVNAGVQSVFLNNHDYPSDFRDTTVVFPVTNEAAMTMLTGMVEREYAVRIV